LSSGLGPRAGASLRCFIDVFSPQDPPWPLPAHYQTSDTESLPQTLFTAIGLRVCDLFGGPILAALQLDVAAVSPPAWGLMISIPGFGRSRLPCHTLHVALSICGRHRKSTRFRVASRRSLATTLTPQVVSAAKPRLAADHSAPAPAWCPRFFLREAATNGC
jgi:hypothetical protein